MLCLLRGTRHVTARHGRWAATRVSEHDRTSVPSVAAEPVGEPAAERVAAEPVAGAGGAHAPADPRVVLKEHGLRFSRPRELILGHLLAENQHVSAEGLYLALKQRGENLSLSTVYLNLGVLAEAGLVREFKGSAGQSLYDSNVSDHFHVVCRETGSILDVPTPMVDGKPLGRYLKEAIEAATGWQVDEPQLSLTGLSPQAREDTGS